MAWHSKRHNIKHRKAAQDSKKAKIFAKASKVIQMAAVSWDDPSLNPALDLAIKQAKQVGLNKDAIKYAVDKWAWNDTWEMLTVNIYEWYAPGGVALVIKCITWNTNRTASSVKTMLSKYGGNIGEPGSVARQFDEKGEIVIGWKIEFVKEKWKTIEKIHSLNDDVFEMHVLESGAEDVDMIVPDQEDAESMTIWRIITAREDFAQVLSYFEERWYQIESSELAYIPSNTLEIDELYREKLKRLIDILEEDEDVDTVRHNAA